MKNLSLKTSAQSLALGLAALCLAACNDNNGITPLPVPPAPVAMTTVSGVAAVGAAISGGAVALRCGGGTTASTTSAANGSWTTSVPTSALPCAVKVSGGTPAGTFYSIARSASGTATTANLTPVSDLALAAAVNGAVGTALEAWFASATDAQRTQVAAGLAAAISSLNTALGNAGYTLPAGSFDPFTAAIAAGASGDVYDQLLEAYRQALADAGTTYEAARGNYTAGANVPAAPSTTPPDDSGVSGPLTAPASANATAFLANLAGDYKLLVDDAYAAGETEFPKGSVHAVQMKADGTVAIRGATKTISYVYAQKTLSDYTQDNAGTATEKDTLRFYAANGGSIDLFITYEPGLGYLTITPQGFTGDSEGGATLVSKKGTPTTMPPTTPPPVGTGKGILGAALNSVFVGDYVLKCSTFGQPVQTFAFSIAADGSSMFNGAPLVDATHPGRIKTEGILSSSITMKFEAAAQDSAYVLLGWRADGSFVPNSVYVPGEPYGQTLSCFSNTGNTAPAATTRALETIPQAVAALARTETLSCSQGGATAPQALTVNSDGSSQLGSQSFAADKIFSIDDSILFGSNKSGTVQYSDISSSASRTLAVSVDADLKTTSVIASVGSGPNDVIICNP